MSPIGQAIKFAGNNWIEWQAASWGLPTKFGTGTVTDHDGLVIQAYFKFQHAASAKESTLYWSDNQTGASNVYGYRLYVDNNTDKLKLMIANNDDMATTFPTYYTSTALTPDRWYHVWVVWDQFWLNFGQACAMWIDGVRQWPTVTPSNPSGNEEPLTHSTGLHARCGTTLGNQLPDFSIALLNVWNRVISEGLDPVLSDKWLNDPLRMFRRKRAGGGKVRTITPWYLDRRRRVG